MRGLAVLILLASMAGFGFAAVSTYDSAAHLDRQVHGIHCSYLLGAGKEDAAGTSGCYATLMSPYSSVFRKSVWGGVPVALAGMSVFGFLIFWTLLMMIQRRLDDPRAAGFLFAATGLPTLTSVVMGYIAIADLDAVCKMCVGIYVSSGVAFVTAGVLLYFACKEGRFAARGAAAKKGAPVAWGTLVAMFCLGVGFVAAPVATYAAMAPDFSHYAGSCGTLTDPRDAERILIPFGPQNRELEMVEVLDPLCVACGLFERRFSSMEEAKEVRRKVMLFPLDNTCNWMVDEAIHPGACAVSEAMICARERASEVLDWAIDHHEEILSRTRQRPEAAAAMVKGRFPELASCVGSAAARAQLNLSLRWAVKNQLQVLTPQVFVGGRRLCDEDTDLGLEYALTRLMARARTGPPPPVATPEARRPVPEPLPRPQRKKLPPVEPAPGATAAVPSGAEEAAATGPTGSAGTEAQQSPETPAPAAPQKDEPAVPAPSAPVKLTDAPEPGAPAPEPDPHALPSKPGVPAKPAAGEVAP